MTPEDGPNLGIIIGCVVGGIVCCAITIGVCFLFVFFEIFRIFKIIFFFISEIGYYFHEKSF